MPCQGVSGRSPGAETWRSGSGSLSAARRVAPGHVGGDATNLAVPRQEADPIKPSSAAAPSKQGFSQFVSRVLDQLSLSAWLPAAMLVGSLVVLLQLHSQSDRNLVSAVRNL